MTHTNGVTTVEIGDFKVMLLSKVPVAFQSQEGAAVIIRKTLDFRPRAMPCRVMASVSFDMVLANELRNAGIDPAEIEV